MEPLRYATLEWEVPEGGGKPVPRVTSISGPVDKPLRTEPEVLVPEEYRDVELLYVDKENGRSAVLKGRVLLPPVVRSADVARGPDGLPLRRPVRNHAPPALRPWQVLDLPSYDIQEGEVLTVWNIRDRDLEEFRASARAELVDIAEERRPRVTNEDVVIMVDAPILRAAWKKRLDTWNAIVDAHSSALAKAATHADIQSVVDRARKEMVEP